MSGIDCKNRGNSRQKMQIGGSKKCTSKKKSDWKIVKTLTTAVGFLALAQNIGVASARSLGLLEGLAPPATGGFGNQSRNDWLTKSTHEVGAHRHKPKSNLLEMVEAGKDGRKSRTLLDNHGNTYIANDCVETLIATTDYKNFWTKDTGMGATEIAPTYYAHDSYSNEPTTAFGSPHVNINLNIKGQKEITTVSVKADKSVVAIDAGDFKGCNVYQTKYGKLFTPTGDVLKYVGPG